MGEGLALDKRAGRIEDAWEKFIIKGIIEPYVVRETIAASWERSLANKINPYRKMVFFDLVEVNDNYHRELIKLTRPFMENLYELVKGSDFMVLLADEKGLITKVYGDPVIKQRTKNSNLTSGADWSEENIGTNCIGLVLKEEKPVQVFAAEHYMRELHFLAGSAAPIYNTDSTLLGVLVMVGIFHDFHPHTLGMVVAAVNAIQNQLHYINIARQLKKSYNKVTAIMESISEGIISLDADGKINMVNSLCSEMLGVKVSDMQGNNISTLLGEKSLLLLTLKEGKEFSDQEIIVNNGDVTQRFSSTTRALRDEKNNISGMVITLRKGAAVHQLVNKVIGAQASFTFDDIIGNDPIFFQSINRAKKASSGDATILLQGESGTGKEMFAQAIHNASPRRKGPFIVINCAGIPRELVESELFGYEDGAFTGARRGGRPGKFELANGGTIFLDEVGDMPLEIQVNLLRVLQEKKVTRLGGQSVILVDTRVIAATHRDLASLVEKGTFRLDLYYRLNTITLYLPSLNERSQDVLLLTKIFVDRISSKLGKETPVISKRIEELLVQYKWPGNVRELHNVLEQALNMFDCSGTLLPEHLPDKLQKKAVKFKGTNSWALEKQEAKYIEATLKQTNWNISLCASLLGIGRNTLYRKIQKYKIGK
ncbi:MAG: sigma-54-dependent Fis family transcriptional regulator [Clostridia bacterium]|nr:sigma-54-dependent Fis family transcriptional regulator [Clostridia bacterium]